MDTVNSCEDKSIENGVALLEQCLQSYENEDFVSCQNLLKDAHSIFSAAKNLKYISICLSFIALIKYKTDSEHFANILAGLEDSRFLAQSSNSKTAIGVNYFCIGSINFFEKNFREAFFEFNKAKELLDAIPILKKQSLYYLEYIFQEKKLLNNFELTHTKDPLVALLRVARVVSAEFDLDKLLTTIAQETKIALEADRCSVFLFDKEKNELHSKIALGLGSQEIRFTASKGLAGHVAISGETIVIDDAYSDERFNKEIDVETGYTTKNLICMPIRNIKYEIVGVFQVLNKLKGSFTKYDEDLLVAIGSSAGIALENSRLFQHQQKMLENQKHLFSSFIDTLAASIDARDKITSGHSTRVKLYSRLICEELQLSEKQIATIEQAAVLHDIGKIGIRDSVLQKEGKLTEEEYEHIQQHVKITHDILSKIYLSEDFCDVVEIASSHHEKYDGLGYFRELNKEKIHIGGRILAVGDVFDAITSRRHYRDKMPIQDAMSILIKDSDTHFDKNIVNAFLNIPTNKIIEVFLTEYDSELQENDKNILKNYKMSDLYDILTNKQAEFYTRDEEKFVKMFESYYNNKSTGK